MAFFGFRAYPTPILKPLWPFFASSAIVYYCVSKMQYAGVRPQRVRRLVNLEGFGMPALVPQDAPRRYADWIDQLKRLHRGELALQTYDGPEGVARRRAGRVRPGALGLGQRHLTADPFDARVAQGVVRRRLVAHRLFGAIEDIIAVGVVGPVLQQFADLGLGPGCVA